MLIEFLEEEEEHDGVHSNPPHKGLRVVAVDEEKLESMKHNENELNLKQKTISNFNLRHTQKKISSLSHHLETRKIFLPPQVFLVLRSHAGEQVIRVHHNVNSCVEQSEKR